MPIGFVMMLVGFVGICAIRGMEPGLSTMVLALYRQSASYILSAIPLFVLMGLIASNAGLSRDAFYTTNKWIGHMRGGLAISTIGSCTAFGAVCGDVIAAAVTMCTVALPEMRRYKYSDKLTLGCIAAGSNLSTLIPPSIGFIIYALLTDVSIGSLFIAGILPGILLALFFAFTILILCRMDPKLASAGTRASWMERMVSLKLIWPFLVLIILVLGGIYTGIFTPTESAAIGVFGAVVLGLVKRRLSWQGLGDSLTKTARLTGMIFILIIGAKLFSHFMTVTEIPLMLTDIIAQMSVPPYLILVIILVFYVLVGFFLDILAVLVLTVPILHPILVSLGFDPILLGVLVILTSVMGSISPPFGVVVFALSGFVTDVPLFTIFRGALPFLAAMFAGLVVILVFPQIAVFLPHLMK